MTHPRFPAVFGRASITKSLTQPLLRLWFCAKGAAKSDPGPGAIQVHYSFSRLVEE
jgi:hypothetical protein